MRILVHVDDIAELFALVLMTDDPAFDIDNSGGTPMSMAGIADVVREFIPEAEISFEHESGGKDTSLTWLIDNSRARKEFAWEPRPYREVVAQMIDEARALDGLAPLAATAQ